VNDDQGPHIRIVQERLVYANQYGNLYDDEVKFEPAGAPGRYVRWKWHAPYSVAVLPLADPDTALLIRNFRHSARREVLEAVKGFGVQAREPREIALIELREELGFSADELTFLGVTVADPSFAHQPMHCFLATGRIDSQRTPEASEVIQGVTEFNLARTPQALQTGQILDAVTLLLLWQAHASRVGGS
jgi:ADP-ribose diphosphatase